MNIRRCLSTLLYAATLLQLPLLLASCATEEMAATADDSVIHLTAGCRELTRGNGAASQNTMFDEGASINIHITTSDGTTIVDNKTFTASAASGGMNTLTPPDPTRPPYYPNGDKTVTIKGYYPSTVNSNTTTFTVQSDQSTVGATETADPYKLSDLMTATVTGQVKTTEDVNLEFQHCMARVTISATASDDLKLKSIKLKNVKITATLNSDGTCSGTGSTDDIIVATNDNPSVNNTLNGVALFPPQTIAGVTFIEVTAVRGTTDCKANYVITSKEFQKGCDYTVSLEVGLQNLTTIAAITDWNAASGTTTVTKVLKYGMYIQSISEAFIYDGTAKTPSDIKVYNKTPQGGDVLLTEGTDYTLAYYNNVNVGEALVVASGVNNFESSAAVQSYQIGKAMPELSFTLSTLTREYASEDKYQVSVTEGTKYDGVTSWTSSDTNVAIVDGNGLVSILTPGTTTIKLETDGSGNYTAASAQMVLNINKRSFSSHVSITEFGSYEATYDGTSKSPVPVVYDGGTGGTRLYDNQGYYTISYSNNTDAGTATCTLTGGGVYYDNTTVSKSFVINKVAPDITMNTDAQTIGIGTTYSCNASATYGTVTYVSSDATIASVNSATGLVTGLKAGTATITASVAAGTNWNATSATSNKTVSITVKNMESNFTAVGYTSYTCPATAVYTFELVGGAGASYNDGRGGYGGTVKASKTLTAGTVVSIYIGGAGTQGNGVAGGTNGTDSHGGRSGASGGGSGGAATEIQIGGSRQLVAGGGGGSSGKRSTGKDGGASSSGNYGQVYGEDLTYFSVGGGGGGGYRGGKQGGFGGGYGGSNYIDSSWKAITNKTSRNSGSGSVKVTYSFE